MIALFVVVAETEWGFIMKFWKVCFLTYFSLFASPLLSYMQCCNMPIGRMIALRQNFERSAQLLKG